MAMPKPLTETELRAHAAQAALHQRCADCTALQKPGWESISGAMNISHLEYVGPLGAEDDWDRLDEYHPQGTGLWSPDAPIALGWHPYNRGALWRCPRCAGAYLRYTEHGGYYEEERIRPLRAELLCAPPHGGG